MQKMNKIKAFYNRMSIKNKISLAYSAVFILMSIVVSLFIALSTFLYYRGSSQSDIADTLDTVEAYILSGNEITDENINKQNSNPFVKVRVFEIKNGDIVPNDRYLFDDFPMPRMDIHIGESEERFDKTKLFFNDAKLNTVKGMPYMTAVRHVMVGENEYVIQVFRAYSHEIKMINRFNTMFVIENLVAVIVAFCVGKGISNKILKPVREVTNTAMNISENDFNRRIDVPEAEDEIRELVKGFNDMLERLQISFERQNQFISDASHELRTPISVIKGYTNMLSRWGKNDKEILDEAIESIASETEHITMLLNRLLFWARNDVKGSMTISELCLEELLDEIKKEADVMELPAQFVFADNSGNTRIDGDYHLIKQLIWIFIENAVKYSGENSCVINFSTAIENGKSILKIKDNGIGINEEDINNIFERFYRSDKSRNKEISGFGLGLSIAKWIVEHHNGKIRVFSEVGKGTEFVLEFLQAT